MQRDARTGEDRWRPGQYGPARDDALRAWMRDEVYPFSAPIRTQFAGVGLTKRAIRSVADLAQIPVTPLADLGDGRAYVLEPTVGQVESTARLSLSARLWFADALGRRDRFARTAVDPDYKPISWTIGTGTTGLFIADTATDLDRLADLGRRALAVSGVRAHDRVAVVGAPGPGIAPWQFQAGCRDGGVAVLHVSDGDPAVLDVAAPTVVAGRAVDLEALEELPVSVRLVLVLDGDPTLGSLPATWLGAPLVSWYTAPGARAAWAQCRPGGGFHTWPQHEHVDVAAGRGGTLVWTPVGWHGSVWLRVDTGVVAVLDDAPCPDCERTTPRVIVVEPDRDLHRDLHRDLVTDIADGAAR